MTGSRFWFTHQDLQHDGTIVVLMGDKAVTK
jgi:hypothetical protein